MSKPWFAEVTMEATGRTTPNVEKDKPSEPKPATCESCGGEIHHMDKINTDRCLGCGRNTPKDSPAPPAPPASKSAERLEGLRPPTSAPTESAKESGEGPISKTAG